MSDPVVGAAEAKRSPARFLPLLAFVLLAGLFLVRLYGGDASRLPSALLGKPSPTFNLPALDGLAGVPGLASDDLRQGYVSVISVFASWCVPCRVEHSTLLSFSRDQKLAAKGVKLYGLSYKDEQKNALTFLDNLGNPFSKIGVDSTGRTAIDFGVYGVPETFVVRGDGVIAYKFVGPLTPESIASTLTPEIEKAMSAPAP